MKIILIIFYLVSLGLFSQNDSSRFIDDFYMELNAGLGKFNYSYEYFGNGSSPPEEKSHNGQINNQKIIVL